MTSHSPESFAPVPLLEKVELELALGLQDLPADGFAQAIGAAAETLGGELLFNMPDTGAPGMSQRIAAIRIGRGEDERILLVTLATDGQSVDVEDAALSVHHLAGFALSHAAMMHQLAAAGINQPEA